MKKVLFIFTVSSHFFVFSQKTIQFSDPLPSGKATQITTDKKFFGNYKSNQSNVTYVIDETGISIQTLMVASVSRKQLRESSQLQYRNNYLFGIKENDSVPCVLEGENYYYGIVSKLPITCDSSSNKLTQISPNSYIINFHEGAYFEPSLLQFTATGLEIIHSELKYQPFFSKFLQVATITRSGSEVAILTPTFEQSEQLKKELFIGEKLIYLKENN